MRLRCARTSPIPVLALVAVLSAPALADGLPPIECVEALRRARIERATLDDASARQRIEAAVELPGCELPALTDLLRLLREGAYPRERAADLRQRLARRLEDPALVLPRGLATYLAAVPAAAEEEEELLLGALSTRVERSAGAEPPMARDELIEILSVVARLQERLDRPRDALATVDRLIALEGTASWRWRGLELAVELEQWEEVARRAESMLELPGAAARLRPLLVTTFARLGRYQEMLAQLELVASSGAVPAHDLVQAPESSGTEALPEFFVGLLRTAGWELRDAGRDADAETIFRRILEIDPEDASAQLVLLHLYGSEQERAEHAAAVAARRSREVDPQALFEEGSQLLAAGDPATAADLLARAAPDLGGTTLEEAAWYNLGLANYKLERWERAARAFARAAALNPDRPESHFQRGLALVRLERCADATPSLERFLELRPERFEARYFLARCYQELGELAAAEREWALYHDAKGGD